MFKKIKRRFFPTKKEIAIDNVHRFFRADYAFIINLVVAVLFFIAGSYSQLHTAEQTKQHIAEQTKQSINEQANEIKTEINETCDKSCIGFYW